ncbi:MAG: hypothetical protein Q4B73_08995 [Lachnospiraceae bacterium]|nr:hypothetical protein [Lachnospiraceae bacterium]
MAYLINRRVTGEQILERHSEATEKVLPKKDELVLFTNVATVDRYGKTYQYGYNSFTLAFYDFELHPMNPSDEFKKTETVTTNPATKQYSYTNVNESYNDATATVHLDNSEAKSLSTTISNAESYNWSVGLDVNMAWELKFTSCKFSPSFTISSSYGQAFETAYSETDEITETTDGGTDVSTDVPAHTAVTTLQTTGSAESTIAYECPVYVTYRVAILSMCGTLYDDNAATLSFSTAGYEQRTFLTLFGNDKTCTDAVEDLYLRGEHYLDEGGFERSYATTVCQNDDGDIFANTLNWKAITSYPTPRSKAEKPWLVSGKDIVGVMGDKYPRSITGARMDTMTTNITTELLNPTPIKPIKIIKTDWQVNDTVKMHVGDDFQANVYRVKAYDEDEVPYYGFASSTGEWRVVNADGEEMTDGPISLSKDPLTRKFHVTANAPGEAWIKYFIPENEYMDYTGTYSTNSDIVSTAYHIVVTETASDSDVNRVTLSGSVEAYVDDEAIDLDHMPTLTARVYDRTDKEVEVALKWEAQELPSRGISVTEDGKLTVSNTGTFHVRAYYDGPNGKIYSDWAEVTAVTKPAEPTPGTVDFEVIKVYDPVTNLKVNEEDDSFNNERHITFRELLRDLYQMTHKDKDMSAVEDQTVTDFALQKSFYCDSAANLDEGIKVAEMKAMADNFKAANTASDDDIDLPGEDDDYCSRKDAIKTLVKLLAIRSLIVAPDAIPDNHVHELCEKHDATPANCVDKGNVEWYDCADPNCREILSADKQVLTNIETPVDPNNHKSTETKWVTNGSSKVEVYVCCGAEKKAAPTPTPTPNGSNSTGKPNGSTSNGNGSTYTGRGTGTANKAPNTGDTSNALPWTIALLLAGAACVTGTAQLKKRKR